MAAGAVAESIEVQVEVDKRRSLVRATAMGTTELRRRDEHAAEQGIEHCRAAAARSLQVDAGAVVLSGEVGNFLVFTAEQETRSFFGLLKSSRPMLRVLDRTGVVRLQRGAAHVVSTDRQHLNDELTRMVEALTDYGDAGRTIPDIFILYGARLANFAGLAALEQVLALAEVELRALDASTRLLAIACPKQV
jgi:hypothetical protein